MRKILWKDHPFLQSISKVRINYYSLTKNWGLESFDSETTALSIFLEICTKTRFHCLFSLNQKIIAMCHLMIHIKCISLICFNKNWSSLKRRFWNNGLSNMVSHFLAFFTFSFLYSIFVESFMIKLSFFNIDFWNSF